jgi:hypothetical protein
MFGKVALNLIFFILNVSNTFKRRFKKKTVGKSLEFHWAHLLYFFSYKLLIFFSYKGKL